MEKRKYTDLKRSQQTIYGPPPIDCRPFLYGPLPIDCRACQKTQPSPSGKKFSCSVIVLVVGALLGGIIAWLLGDCSNFNQSTVYGPPPVDTTQTVVPIDNE